MPPDAGDETWGELERQILAGIRAYLELQRKRHEELMEMLSGR
jgi:hypothetical protein